MAKDAPGEFYSSAHISLAEAGKAAASPELIAAYVRIGGDAAELRSLHQLAEAATRAAGRQRRQGGGPDPDSVRPPQEAKSVVDYEEVRAHYVVVAQEIHYRFNPAGAIADSRCVIRLRAKAPGVRLYYQGFTYPTDQRRGVLTVEPLAGLTVDDVRESDTGMIATYFKLDRDLGPDEADPYTVAYRIRVDSPVRATPRLRYFAAPGIERLVLKAEFPPEADPAVIWWFGARDIVEAEHRVPGRELQPSPSGYERTFDDFVPSWCYGFAWNW
jgi:hypothetical protein